MTRDFLLFSIYKKITEKINNQSSSLDFSRFYKEFFQRNFQQFQRKI